MDALSKELDKIENLVFEHNYGYKVKYDIDELYDMRTGQTVCQDITTATDEQVRDLLQIKKNPLQRVQK